MLARGRDAHRHVAVALALVLTAAAVALSVRIDQGVTARLDSYVPVVDRAVAPYALRPQPVHRTTARPCRVSGLTGVERDHSMGRMFHGDLWNIEVALDQVPDPHARLRTLADGLRRCGQFQTEGQPPVYAYGSVTTVSEDRVTWTLTGDLRGEPGNLAGGYAELRAVGPYLLYVAETRYPFAAARRAHVTEIADQIAAEVQRREG